MKRFYTILMVMMLIVLAGCQGEGQERGFFGGGSGDGAQTFIGGTLGVVMSFTEQRPPQDVFAGGDDAFDVEVKLENRGEFDISQSDMRVVLTGIDPAEFGKTQQDFVEGIEEDMSGRQLDQDGNEIPSLPQYVLYENLNHVDPVIGTLEFPVQVEACYSYGTNAISALCYKEDQRRTGGVCEVSGTKEMRVSGSPIQISEFSQSPVSQDSFAFSFKIVHQGNGQVYEQGQCTGRDNENKVFVKVDTGYEGVSCSGLRGGTAGNEGYVDLRSGEAPIRCRQDVRDDIVGSFVKPVEVQVIFNYKESIATTINVKQSDI